MLKGKNGKNKTYAVLGLITMPAIVSGIVLSSSFASAEDSVVDTITAIVPVSCMMSGSGTSSHSAEIVSGTYVSNIGTTTLNVVCNDSAGFSIYAAGFTGNTIGETNSNKLVGTAASGNATIDTGTATGPGYDDESNWAMKLDTDYYAEYPIDIENGYDDYSSVPNSYTKVATRLTGTDAGTGATGASLTTTYAAYISKTQPADTYTGQVKYVLLHPNTQTPPTSGSVDYVFFEAGKDRYKGFYKMQDMSDAICAEIPDSQSGTLIDPRDDNTYTIAKIAGRCWMTQNLRFTETTLDPSTSNVASVTTITYDDLVSGNSYDEAMIHTGLDSDGAPTVWYNYAAASAKTITGESNDTDAIYDICPAGWRLPTQSEISSITSYVSAFSPVAGGVYGGGTLYNLGYGDWWSATASSFSTANRYFLSWDSSSLVTNNYGGRHTGSYIRCVNDTTPTMQAQTASSLAAVMPNEGDSVILKDSRDDKKYEVTKINSNYWMTQNLRFTGTNLDPSTSNVASATTVTYGDLTSGNSYDEARIHEGVDGNGDPTVWYNYAAASATTITGSSNDTDATHDVCPAGWRLPTQSEFSGIVPYASAFNPVIGGYYRDGTLDNSSYGYWWSATAYDTTARDGLYWDGEVLNVGPIVRNRSSGTPVRCVKK